MDVACYYCTFKANAPKDVIEHLVEHHRHKTLKIKCGSIDSVSFKRGYQTKDFRIIPSEVLKPGEKFGIIEDTLEIFIDTEELPDINNLSIHELECDLNECINSPLSKKTKCSTPNEKSNVSFDSTQREPLENNDQFLSEIINLAPSVTDALKNAGFLETWLKLNRMISEGTFPFGNIAFLLFMDVCKFLDSKNTSSMKYSEPIKKFWRIGYRLFHGKWLKFMGGPKHGGMLLSGDCEKGIYDPKESNINFAVPVRSIMSSKLSPVTPADINPGILNPLLDTVAENSSDVKTYKICLDGKKINASTSGKGGEIDLWGHESKPTLKERQDQLNTETVMIEDASNVVQKAIEISNYKLDQLGALEKSKLKDLIINIITTLSKRLKILREVAVQKMLTKGKLQKSVEGDWRKSKLVFVISGLITYLYDLNACIKNLLCMIDKLCFMVATINRCTECFVTESIVNLSMQKNYVHLRECNIDSKDETKFRFIKQRSQLWHTIRDTARATGSTINNAIGLRTLKDQQEHFDDVIFKKPKPEPSSTTKEKMEYGTENEKHAIATLVGKVLPVYNPQLKYIEEGCYRVSSNGTLVVISPDGSCRPSFDSEALFGVECKCPFPGKTFTTQVFYNLPTYYVTQVLSEMYALQATQLYLICYSEESTTVQKVTFDLELWNAILNEVHTVLGGEKPIRPSKKSEASKVIQKRITAFVENNVEFIAEVPSIKCIDCELQPANETHFCCHIPETNHCRNEEMTLQQALEVLYNCDIHVSTAYKLTKPRASEFLGFMISDLDREYKSEQLHSIPIAYGLKGYSMPTAMLRGMIEEVLSECSKRGLYVPVVSFDGQWYRLVVRDRDNNPLTVLQLQKDVHASVRKMSKAEIMKYITETNLVALNNHANITDVEQLINVEYTTTPKRLIVKGLKTGAPLKMSKHTCDMLRKKTHISNSDLLKQDEIGTAESVSILPENVIDQLTDDVVDDILLQSVNVTPDIESVDIHESIHSDTSACIDTLFDQQAEPAMDESGGNNITEESLCPKKNILLDDGDVSDMLTALQSDIHKKTSRQGKWNITPEKFKGLMSDAITIDKSFLAYELQICLKPVIGKLKCNGVKVNQSSPKHILVNIFSNIFGDGSEKQHKIKDKTTQKVKSLKTLSRQAVQKIPKEHLNVIIAENKFPSEISRWFQQSPFGNEIKIDSVNTDNMKCWYSRPEFNVPLEHYIFMILDAYHQVCGLRRLVCENGIPATSVSKDMWHKVAEESENNHCGLNVALVKDLIDRQSVAYAVKTFSVKVENALLEIGAENEANFCKLIRKWYEAEDEPGITSIERCQSRLQLRDWLLKDVNFGMFPPYGSHIKDIPVVLYEGLLTGIERRLQLYSFTKTGTYNVRAVGSLDIENFFGSFQDIDPWGTGVLRPEAISTALSVAVELTEARLDPERYK